MIGPNSGPGDDFDSEALELSLTIQEWVDIGIIDFESRTLRDDFSTRLIQLDKTDVHIRDLEKVFKKLMEKHFKEGVRTDKQYLRTMPKDVFAVLTGKESLDLGIPNRFFVDLVEQMRVYYGNFLDWKGA